MPVRSQEPLIQLLSSVVLLFCHFEVSNQTVYFRSFDVFEFSFCHYLKDFRISFEFCIFVILLFAISHIFVYCWWLVVSLSFLMITHFVMSDFLCKTFDMSFAQICKLYCWWNIPRRPFIADYEVWAMFIVEGRTVTSVFLISVSFGL